MITIRNASGAVLTHFDNNVPEGNPYMEPEMTENMESLVSSFSFSVPMQLADTEYLSELNQVLAKDKDDDLRVFVINNVYEDWNTTDGTVRVEAEDISITEMNGIILPPINANNFNDALKAVFNKTGWTYELTANPSNLDRALFATEEYMNMREALVQLRTVYGCQFKFMAQEDAFGKLKRVVKVYKNRGNNTGKYFYYDRDLLNIERDINYDSIYTAVYATYKNEAGQPKNLINWLPNYPIEGYTKDYSSPLIIHDKAHVEWDDPAIYRTMLHKSELHDPNQVFQEAVDALGKSTEPTYTYKMNVLLLQNMVGWEGEDIQLGDTVWAKERVGNRELGLEARVVEYVYHEDDPTLDTVTFSNYREIDTTDAKELANRIYFAWANSPDGSKDFSTTDSVDKLYMGVYSSDVDVQSTDPTVYSWTRIKGEDGVSAPILQLTATSQIMKFKSDNTPDGAQTINFEAYVKYMAEDSVTWKATPYKGTVAQPDIPLSGTGLKRTITSADWNKDWTRLVVLVNANGLADVITVTKVSDGANGEDGEAIVGFLTNEAVTFSATSAGVVNDYSTGKGQFILYEGLRPVTSGVVYALQSSSAITVVINPVTGEYAPDKMTANMAQAIFTASYKGVTITKSMSFAKSVAGTNGSNGTDGTDGNTVWTAYANNDTGTKDFSLTDPNRDYIGTASGKPSDGQPTDPSKYRWSRIKGADGTSFSMSGDSSIMKFDANGDIKAGQLITFTAIKKVLVDPIFWQAVPYIDNVAQPPITLGGTAENKRTLAGSQWGYGITSIKVTATCGDYEDTFTVIKLQDGAKGQDGASTYTHIGYANSSNGSLDFTNTPDPEKTYMYIGVYTGSEKNPPADFKLYTWMLFKGEAGANNYIHTAYANSEDGTDGFTTEYPKPNLMQNTLQETLSTYSYSHNSKGGLDVATPANQPQTYTKHTIRVTSAANSAYGMATQTLNGSTAGFKLGDKVTVTALVYVQESVSTATNAFVIGKYDVPSGSWVKGETKSITDRGKWVVISHTVTITDLSTLFAVGLGGAASTTEIESFWLAAMKVEKNGSSTGLYPNPLDDPNKAIPSYLGILVDNTETPSQNPADYTWSKYSGTDGENGITALLTNEVQQVAATADGGVTDYTSAKGTFQLFDGTSLVTSGVSFRLFDADGGTTSIDSSTGFYSVTNVTKDVTNFVYEASYKSLKIQKTFTVSKSKQGVQGIQGVQGLMGIAFYSPTPPTGQGVEEGATWFKTVSDSDNTILSINKFKDGNWIETSLASGALAVESLSAISADLGNITAGTITGVKITSAVFESPFDTQTSEANPRHIKGTTTISAGRMQSYMDFPDTPIEDRRRAWFTAGPDSLKYQESGGATSRVKLVNVFNSESFYMRRFDDDANPNKVTQQVYIDSDQINLKGGDDPESYFDIELGTLKSLQRTKILGSTSFDGGYIKEMRMSGGHFVTGVAKAKAGSEPPNAGNFGGIQNVDTATMEEHQYVSLNSLVGLTGQYKGSLRGDVRWNIPPDILKSIPYNVANTNFGNTAPVTSWTGVTSGQLVPFHKFRYQTYGPWSDGSGEPFSISSDGKNIRYEGLGDRENISMLRWKMTAFGKIQIGGNPSGANHYTYLTFMVNGAERMAIRIVWPNGVGWQQTSACSTVQNLKVGDIISYKFSTGLPSNATWMGGCERFELCPIINYKEGNLY